MRIIPITLAFLVPAGAAMAHTGIDGAAHSGFSAGFLHPIGGLDHVLAMVAVGLLAYLVGERRGSSMPLWLIPASFVAVMVVGGVLGVYGAAMPLVELGIGLSIVVIGAAAAFGRNLPVAAAMALVGFFAVFHGFAHGAEMPQSASGLVYGLGFMIATALLHVSGLAAAMVVTRTTGTRGAMIARAGGGIMALAGVAIIGGAI